MSLQLAWEKARNSGEITIQTMTIKGYEKELGKISTRCNTILQNPLTMSTSVGSAAEELMRIYGELAFFVREMGTLSLNIQQGLRAGREAMERADDDLKNRFTE